MTNVHDLLHDTATRKAMRRLLPILGVAYFMSYVDRTNISLAKTALEADVGIGAAAYGLGAGLFFLSYALLEVPSNLVLHKVGARVWITRIAVSWGLVSAAMMFVQDEVSFYVLRLLLGATEAGLFPALMYLVTIWFDQKHRVTMVGLIYLAPSIAILIGAPIGGALMELDGSAGLQGWQWMFLVEGLFTVLIGILVWFTLPSRPADASWLTEEESDELTRRAVAGQEPPTRVRGHLRDAFGNPVVLVLALIYFVNQAIASGVGFNFPAFIQSLGLTSPFLIGLVAGSGGISALAGALFFPWAKQRWGREVALIGVCAAAVLVILIGFIATAASNPVLSVVLVFVSNFFVIGTLPLFWSVAMSRMSGVVAAAGLAFINTIGITGGFVGPFVYGLVQQSTKSLVAPFWVAAGAAVVGVALVGLLAVLMRREERAGAPVPV